MAAPRQIRMFDSVDVAEIPADASAVAGYVNGRWPTFATLQKNFPHADKLSIAVSVHADADCLDVEKFDATPDEAPHWVKRQLRRGVKRPVVYTSVSEALAVISALKEAGIKRSQFRLWTAHYTGKPHRCTAYCGFGFRDKADATQFTNNSHGRNLDESLCAPDFFEKPVSKKWFRFWASWVRHGRKWRRPGSAPKRIPFWAWRKLR